MEQSSVFREFLPILICFRVFGLVDFNVAKPWRLALSVLLYSVLVAVTVLGFYWLVDDYVHRKQKEHINDFWGALTKTGVFVASIIINVQSIFTLHVRHRFFESFTAIDQLLQKGLPLRCEFFEFRKRLSLKILLILGILTIGYPIPIYLTATVHKQTLVYWTGSLCSLFVNNFAAILYFFCIELTQHRLQMTLRTVNDLVVQSKQNFSPQQITQEIGILREVYSRLSGNVALINGCFGVSLLAIVISNFIEVTNSFYSFYLAVLNVLPSSYMLGWYSRI